MVLTKNTGLKKKKIKAAFLCEREKIIFQNPLTVQKIQTILKGIFIRK